MPFALLSRPVDSAGLELLIHRLPVAIPPLVWVVVGVVLLLGLALYVELVLAEGTHLGQWTVTALYNATAHRYESIKQFNPTHDDRDLGEPLLLALEAAGVPQPRILDVGAGTGRLARTLARQPNFHGHLIGLDPAQRMLAHAAAPHTTLLLGRGETLPFPDASFDAVACLETLEFTARPATVLAECVRVLRPGGTLLLTNRVGLDRWLLAGKIWTRPQFRHWLGQHPLSEIQVYPWLDIYDLAWATKTTA